MVYVRYESFYRNYSISSPKAVGQTCFYSKQYQIPEGMDPEEAFKVISCLIDCVEGENKLEENYFKIIQKTSELLPSYGFKEVEGTEARYSHSTGTLLPLAKLSCLCEFVPGVADLIIYGGEEKLFRRSEIRKRYFEWYTPNVTKEEVDEMFDTIEFIKENNIIL